MSDKPDSWIVVRLAKEGPAVAVGLDHEGVPVYVERYKAAMRFADRESASRFMQLVHKANLPIYANMDEHLIVKAYRNGRIVGSSA